VYRCIGVRIDLGDRPLVQLLHLVGFIGEYTKRRLHIIGVGLNTQTPIEVGFNTIKH
jgi:hypothetical protein